MIITESKYDHTFTLVLTASELSTLHNALEWQRAGLKERATSWRQELSPISQEHLERSQRMTDELDEAIGRG